MGEALTGLDELADAETALKIAQDGFDTQMDGYPDSVRRQYQIRNAKSFITLFEKTGDPEKLATWKEKLAQLEKE